MSRRIALFSSEDADNLSNGIGRIGREYKSTRGSSRRGFMCGSQNGWNYEDNDGELKEEDIWGTATSCDQYYADKIRASSSPSATKDVVPAKVSKDRKSWLGMELQAVGMTGRKKEHVGVGFGAVEALQKGGREINGGWATGFSTRKVQIPYCSGGGAGGSECGNGRHRQDSGGKPGGVPQSAPMSISVWRAKCGYSEVKEGSSADDNDGEDDGINEDNHSDDEHDEGDGRLAPHEIVDREYARSQTMTFSVIEGAGRTLKGMDLRRVRNAVWSCTGFED